MKTQTTLRQNKMNNTLRSILASSLIAITMMSCTKENIEPTTVNSFENARKRSNLAVDQNATRTTIENANNNAQALVEFITTETINEPAYKIIISRYADVFISQVGEPADQFNQFRLSPVKFTHLLDYIETYNNNDQAFTASNSLAFNINTVAFRSCNTCDVNTFHNNGNAQERIEMNVFMTEVDRIIDLRSLIHQHNNNASK